MTAFFSKPPALQWSEINFGRELDPGLVQNLVLGLVANQHLGVVIFEAEAKAGSIIYRIGSSKPSELVRTIETTVPGCIITPGNRKLPSKGIAGILRINTRRRAIRTDSPEGMAIRLLSAVAANPKTLGIHQVIIGGRLRPNAVPNKLEMISAETWPRALMEAAVSGRTPVDSQSRRALTSKESMPGALVTVRVLAAGPSKRGLIAAFESACRTLESPGVRLQVSKDSWAAAVEARPSRKSMPLNAEELMTVLAWPLGDGNYPGIDRTGSRLLAPVQAKNSRRVIGMTTHPGRAIALGQFPEDGLRHTHVIGPTGVGKSTLLLNLILQDIADGRGVVVLDPKGDLVDDVLARVPDKALDQVVVIDAARHDQVVGFNPLHVSSQARELAVDGVLHVFHQLYANSWGPRTQDILHSALLTLVGSPFSSIVFVPQLLIDHRFRRDLIKHSKNTSQALRFFWGWYDGLSEAERNTMIAPVMNKLRPFLLRSSLRGLLGQIEPHFDPKTIFTERKVLLVPLRKGQIGPEAANLLGSLIVGHLWQLAQSRSSIDPKRRHPVFLYLDEFQDYLHLPTDFGDVLAQARGLGLGLILTHQHLGQLTPSVKSAVLANAQSRICFRLGADDAQVLARAASELDAEDFTGLAQFQIYASLLTGGSPTPFASAQTMVPSMPTRKAEKAGAVLAERWGRSLSEVDAAMERTGRNVPDDDRPVGRKKRGKS